MRSDRWPERSGSGKWKTFTFSCLSCLKDLVTRISLFGLIIISLYRSCLTLDHVGQVHRHELDRRTSSAAKHDRVSSWSRRLLIKCLLLDIPFLQYQHRSNEVINQRYAMPNISNRWEEHSSIHSIQNQHHHHHCRDDCERLTIALAGENYWPVDRLGSEREWFSMKINGNNLPLLEYHQSRLWKIVFRLFSFSLSVCAIQDSRFLFWFRNLMSGLCGDERNGHTRLSSRARRMKIGTHIKHRLSVMNPSTLTFTLWQQPKKTSTHASHTKDPIKWHYSIRISRECGRGKKVKGRKMRSCVSSFSASRHKSRAWSLQVLLCCVVCYFFLLFLFIDCSARETSCEWTEKEIFNCKQWFESDIALLKISKSHFASLTDPFFESFLHVRELEFTTTEKQISRFRQQSPARRRN